MQQLWQIQQFEQNSTRRLTQWQDMAMMGLGSDKNTRKYKSISRSGSQVGWTETNKTNEGRLSIFFSVYELCQCFPAIKTVGRKAELQNANSNSEIFLHLIWETVCVKLCPYSQTKNIQKQGRLYFGKISKRGFPKWEKLNSNKHIQD